MCYQCGCGRSKDEMGAGHAAVDPNGKSITDSTFKAAGEVMGVTEQQAKENTYELLKKVLNK
jgi:hypothetical protein